MHNKKVLAISLALFLTALACSVQVTLPDSDVTTGPTMREEINVPAAGEETLHSLRLDLGAAQLDINPGAGDALVEGVIAYNVEELRPEIIVDGRDVEITQDDFDFDFSFLSVLDDLENHWDLRLGAVPLNLEINTGAIEGDFELGGLAIQNLSIFAGASDMQLLFSEPNLIEMGTLRVNIGASEFRAEGLGNANFSEMEFEGGVGDYSLNFSGELQRDASVDVNVGFSELTIIVPEDTAVEVRLTGGLTDVGVRGNWSQSGTTYIQAGEGPTLTIFVEMGAGSLSLGN